MRLNVLCPTCGGDQTALVESHTGASHGGQHESLTDLWWLPPTEPTDCWCERTDEDKERIIEAANEPRH